MLTTGNQLRAARALAEMDQGELARQAGVNINTIGSMEKRGSQTLVSGLDTIRAVMNALEAAGVEFLNHGQPGVRLAKRAVVDLIVAAVNKGDRSILDRMVPWIDSEIVQARDRARERKRIAQEVSDRCPTQLGEEAAARIRG